MIKFYVFLLFFPKIILALNTDIAIQSENIFDSEFLKFAKCIVRVAKQDMSYKPTILIQSRNAKSMTRTEKILLNMMVHELNLGAIPLITVDSSAVIFSEDEYDGHLLFITINEDCKDLENLTFDAGKANYLFILTGDVQTCNNTFEKIGTLIIHPVTITYKDKDGFVFMNTYKEINQSTCTVSEHLKLSNIDVDCNDNNIKQGGAIFQPKVIKNFKQCPFNFGLATLYPYMLIKNKEHKYKNLDPIVESDISGSDVELLKIIAKYFNASLNFYFISREEENSFADREFIDLVSNGSLDVCAGGLYRVYGDSVAYSGIYTRQEVIWVYSVEREIRSWQSFVKKVNGLYMFLIFYLVYSLFWRILCKMDRQPVSMMDIFLYGWGALLGTTSLQDARNLKQKITNAMYLIMSLHLSAYISVQLYSYLTIQSPPHLYKTIDELISSGIKPYLRYPSKYFIEDKKYTAFANTSGSCDNFIHCEEVILERKGTTILIDGHLPPYQADTAINDEARVVQVNEIILFVYHEMILRKDSFFSEPFRKTIQRLFEAGVIKKLYDDAIGIMDVHKARIANKNIMSNSYSCQVGCKITLTQSAGAFYLWIFGCILSLVVFCFEVLMNRKR